MIDYSSRKLCLSVAIVTLFGLSACDNTQSNRADSNEVPVDTEVSTPNEGGGDITATPVADKDCSNGLKVKLPSISGKEWNKGVSTQSAAILLDAETLTNPEEYSALSFGPDGQIRDILSVKVINMGRQVVNLDGDIIVNDPIVTEVCFLK